MGTGGNPDGNPGRTGREPALERPRRAISAVLGQEVAVAEKLTKRTVDRLIAEADPARDVLVWDAAVPGLVLRLRSGSARFAFQYKRRGRTRRVTIGAYGPLTLDQARDQARERGCASYCYYLC
jgi:hypothetical protein